MKDITNPTVIWMKGALFLALGVASALLLLAEAATMKVALLLVLAVWGFCRAYYFAFYGIEHFSLIRYLAATLSREQGAGWPWLRSRRVSRSDFQAVSPGASR